MIFFLGLLILLLKIFIVVIFVRVVLSWLVSPYPTNAVMRFFWAVTEPVLAPIRRRVQPVSGIDLSPLVVLLAASVLIALLSSYTP